MRTKMPRLRQKLGDLIQRAKAIFLIFQECKMQITEVFLKTIQDDYVDSIKEQLIEITYDWCNGDDFEAVTKKTDSY